MKKNRTIMWRLVYPDCLIVGLLLGIIVFGVGIEAIYQIIRWIRG